MYWNITGETITEGLPTVLMAIGMWWIVYKLLTYKGTKTPTMYNQSSYLQNQIREEEDYGFIDFGKKK